MSIASPSRAPSTPKAPSEYIEAGVRRMFSAGALSQLRFMGYDRTVTDRSLCIEIWTCPREQDLGRSVDVQERYYLTIDYFSKATACTCPGFQRAGACKHSALLLVKLGMQDIKYPICPRCAHGMYDQDPERPNVWRCGRHGELMPMG